MFSATYFTYAGTYSGEYGLMIADFDEENVVETTSFSPSISTVQARRLNRHFLGEITYSEMPTYEFSIISATPMTLSDRRNALSWLLGHNTYQDLIFHQTNLDGTVMDDFKFRCVFSNVSLIYVNTSCCGFRITANFDSPFARGKESVLSVNLSSTSTVPYVDKVINNTSDINDYVYPFITYTMDAVGSMSNALTIYNASDDSLYQRPTTIWLYNSSSNPAGMSAGDTITIDNELKLIKNSDQSKKEVLGCFNKNWLRLKKGPNTLRIYGHGSLTISCPSYAMIGL